MEMTLLKMKTMTSTEVWHQGLHEGNHVFPSS